MILGAAGLEFLVVGSLRLMVGLGSLNVDVWLFGLCDFCCCDSCSGHFRCWDLRCWHFGFEICGFILMGFARFGFMIWYPFCALGNLTFPKSWNLGGFGVAIFESFDLPAFGDLCLLNFGSFDARFGLCHFVIFVFGILSSAICCFGILSWHFWFAYF